MDSIDRLNEILLEKTRQPRITAFSIHFTPGGRAQASLTVSFGQAGMGYGNFIMGRDDKRLEPIYELMKDIIVSAP